MPPVPQIPQKVMADNPTGILKATVPGLPTLIVDSREQLPFRFMHLPTAVAGLVTGDYSIKGMEDVFAVERKSIPDLIASVTRERDRFMRELQRIKAHDFRRLLVVGRVEDIATDCRGANPRAIMASLHAIESRGIPVVFIADPAEAALVVERWGWWTWRQSLKAAGIKLETPRWAVAMP